MDRPSFVTRAVLRFREAAVGLRPVLAGATDAARREAGAFAAARVLVFLLRRDVSARATRFTSAASLRDRSDTKSPTFPSCSISFCVRCSTLVILILVSVDIAHIEADCDGVYRTSINLDASVACRSPDAACASVAGLPGRPFG
jgi:hypothetical protein